MDIIRDQRGRLAYSDNLFLVNTRDYLLTKKYIPRYYDYNTKNTSAINLHILLKKLGIKNNNEHLQTFNPQLIGVDPWDPLLTDEVKLAIITECRNNYWYIYREIIRIKNGTEAYNLNITNYCAIYLMLRNINFFLEATRQTGKTEVITQHCGLEFNFERNLVLAVAHYDGDGAADNIGKIDLALKGLPTWMQFHDKSVGKTNAKTGITEIRGKARSASKKQTLKNEMFNNLIKLEIVGQSKAKANTTGRGATIATWFIDEIPHIKFNKVAFESLNQTTKEAKLTAKKNNKPFGYRLLGTPGALETDEGTWMFENIKKNYIPMNETSLELLDMTEEEIRAYAKEKSLVDIFHIKFDFDKMGKDADWFSERCVGESVNSIRSELLVIWEDRSATSPFPAGELAKLTNHSLNKKKVSFKLKDFIQDFDPLTEIKIYHDENQFCDNWIDFLLFNYRDGIVIGLDVSQGVGGDSDSTVFTFVDCKTGVIVAQIKDNTLEMNDLIILVTGLCIIFSENGIKAAFAIERNDGTGTALIQQLKRIPHVQKYLLAYPVAEWKLNNPNAVIDFEFKDDTGKNIKTDFGCKMTSDTRDNIMGIIQTLVKKYTRCICIPDLVSEIKSLITYTKKGTYGASKSKIAAAPGKHDDQVLSAGHAYNALFNHASMLRRRHGIIVTPDNWLINEDIQAFTFSNRRANSRVSIIMRERNGKIYETFYDNLNKCELNQMEAQVILDGEKEINQNRFIVNKNKQTIEEAHKDELNDLFDKQLEDLGSSNISRITDDEYKFLQRGIDTNSNNMYEQTMDHLIKFMKM